MQALARESKPAVAISSNVVVLKLGSPLLASYALRQHCCCCRDAALVLHRLGGRPLLLTQRALVQACMMHTIPYVTLTLAQ